MSNKYSRKIGPLESAYRNVQSYAADEKDILTRAASAGKDGSASALVAALRRAKAEKAAETERQKSGFERAHDVPESGSSADTIIGAARKFILGECDTIDSIDADKDFASKREIHSLQSEKIPDHYSSTLPDRCGPGYPFCHCPSALFH